MWTNLPAGVFSLGDAEGVDGNDPAESIAYSIHYSTHPSFRGRLSVLRRCLWALFRSRSSESRAQAFSQPAQTESL